MIPLDQNPSRRGRYGKDWHGMSEKGLERETEGISVGEREPVVADSSPKGGRLRSSWKKLWKGRKRKALALLLVVAIAGGVVIWRGRGQTASAATTYQEAAVERRSITNSLSSSGTLEPADSYTVNTLVSGEILSDTFEKGDQVEEGQLLYTIDSSNAASSQTQAQNSYSQAQTSYEQAVKAKYPQADLSGTVSEVYVNEGDSVSAGTQLLKIVADENIYIDFYFTYADSGDFYIGQTATVFIDGFAGTLTGTVAAVSSSSAAVSTGVPLTTVRVRLANPGLVTSDYTASAVIGSYSSYGQASIKVGASSVITAEASGKVAGFNWLVGDTISSGDRICTITGDSVDNQIESARISVSNASTSLENARDNLEDYSVTAPISGTVVTKNAKAGDNIEGGSGSTLCVIYDLSYLEMTMSIDELDISSVEVGQEVRITADAVEGKTYTGVVTEVSVAGTTSGGITTYPVTVRIDETDGLLPGMNVDAEIVISSADDVLAIPSAAVSRGDMVLVTANSPSAVNALDTLGDSYDYVFIDCPPSLELLTLDSLCAADTLLVPVQCEYYALEGLSDLMYTVRLAKRSLNPNLDLEGVVLTMYDGRTNLSMQVAEEVKRYFPGKVYASVIPRNVRLSEAPSHGKPVLAYDKWSRGAEAYEALAEEFHNKNKA